jgi:hypothetical protein
MSGPPAPFLASIREPPMPGRCGVLLANGPLLDPEGSGGERFTHAAGSLTRRGGGMSSPRNLTTPGPLWEPGVESSYRMTLVPRYPLWARKRRGWGRLGIREARGRTSRASSGFFDAVGFLEPIPSGFFGIESIIKGFIAAE